MDRFLSPVAMVLQLLIVTTQTATGQTLAWWRFEDLPTGQSLDARMGSARYPFTTTADSSGNGHSLRTFNTRPDLYPPDTSPAFVTDVGAVTVEPEIMNHRSVRFSGKQYLYTVENGIDAALYKQTGAAPFTLEGSFKLEKMPYDYDGRPQTLLCKAASPVIDPIELAIEKAPALSTRPAGPTSNPTTNRSAIPTPNTQPTTTTKPTTKPGTRPTSRPATTRTTMPAYEGSTERINDHPVQPIICFVAGTNAWPEPADVAVDHFGVVLIDARGKSHVLRSQQPLEAGRWYAFAIVFDGGQASLYLTQIGSQRYELQSPSVHLTGGLWRCKGSWMIGCGLLDDVREDWYQGWIDEVRLSAGALSSDRFLTSRSMLAATTPSPATGSGLPPASIIHSLADPDVLLDDGTYYLYGTRDQASFPVYISTDLLHWDRCPDVFQRRRGMWGIGRYWAPSVIHYRDRYYLFYSCLGRLGDSGERMSHRVCIAVADQPTGPFNSLIAPLPLMGKAVIDPNAFVDPVTGHVYLYFVADMSENEVSQIFVAELNENLTSIVGEPVLCIEPTQVWEGKFWNEGPYVFRSNGVYVMTYSAQFWHSPDYGVGFATSRSPTGPWTKNPANPILQHWRGLFGSGGNCVAPIPHSPDMAIFFHADGPPGTHRRDTYIDRLVAKPDSHLGVMLKPEAWSPAR